MFEIIALLTVLTALALLIILSVIDLKEGLLPNEYVLGLAISGAVFHLSTGWAYLSFEDMALGGFIGAAFLYVVRAAANRFYKQDTLGLGDVKLLGAAGIWLGPHYIMLALTLGAAAGLLHGILVALQQKTKSGVMPSLDKLSLPAGPGFAIGIVVAGIVQFQLLEKIWP